MVAPSRGLWIAITLFVGGLCLAATVLTARTSRQDPEPHTHLIPVEAGLDHCTIKQPVRLREAPSRDADETPDPIPPGERVRCDLQGTEWVYVKTLLVQGFAPISAVEPELNGERGPTPPVLQYQVCEPDPDWWLLGNCLRAS